MAGLMFNNPGGLDAMVKTIVRQSFPSATPSEQSMKITEKGLRETGAVITTRIPGTRAERFVWGSSRMGCSRLVG